MSSLHYDPSYYPGKNLADFAGYAPTVKQGDATDYTLVPKRYTCSSNYCKRHDN